ncbi:hypothetical protein PSPO01_12749 [Paraphaeosphaeria sporulosa]
MPSRTVPPSTWYSRPSTSQAAADAIPILVDDEYHVFHLSTPPNTIRHPPRLRSSWSRLRSRDLLKWERDQTEVLIPGKTRDSPDADGAWTGCAILGPDGNMHIFYTGYNLSQDGKQVILHARSDDKKGTKFTKTPCPISITGDLSRFEDIDFRDAHVSRQESENCYWMLVATRLRTGPFWTRGCLALLTSPDLEAWTIDPRPFYAPNDIFCPECPELFSLPNGKWYLVYSRFQAPDAGTVYRVADSPRGPFKTPRASSGGRFDARRWYAAKSCPKAGDPSKRIYFGWVADKFDGQWSWGGDMAMPREVFADKNGQLVVQPCPEFLRAMFAPCSEVPIPTSISISSLGETKISSLSAMESVPNEYHLNFQVAASDAASFGLIFRTSKDMDGHRLRMTPASPYLCDVVLAKYPAPLDDFWADQYKMHLPREVDGPEIARHLVDIRGNICITVKSNVLEIFVGGKSISYRLPGASDSNNKFTIEANGHENGQTREPLLNGIAEVMQELSVFVEDGSLQLMDVRLRARTN